MFDWLKRKKTATQNSSMHPETLDLFFGPLDLCGQITDLAVTYIKAIEAGEKTSPAAKRRLNDPASSVREIWADTRVEAAIQLISFPNAQLARLAQMVEQQELLPILISSPKHFRSLSPSGDHTIDTAQGVLSSLLYLRDRGLEAGAAFALDSGHFRNFVYSCTAAWHEIQGFNATLQGPVGGLPKRPDLLVHVWWREVSQLSKEIALAQIYGSDFRAALKDIVSYARSKGERVDDTDVQSMITRIETAKEPDDLFGA